MYLGRIVETGDADAVFGKPNHPYTQALLDSVPRVDVIGQSFRPIRGELPSPLAPPPGCHFHLRCPHAMDICRRQAPALAEVGSRHLSACHLNAAPPGRAAAAEAARDRANG
jgi:peptide/nickel transport system ATP-binding protein